MSEEHVIGKFCSVAKKNTIVTPKDIPGYITPEGQVLKKDGQKFDFIYTPIKYNIFYDLHGGNLTGEIRTSYTIESETYTPPTPTREGYQFLGWEPESIPTGSMGEVLFEAKWKADAILLSGKKLRKAFKKIANDVSNVVGIVRSYELPEGEYINISSTETPIFAKFKDGVISVYCDSDIYCNKDMGYAFSRFTLLNYLTGLRSWICNPGTNINSLFKDCKMLSNVSDMEHWADFGKFSDFTDAFAGTVAFESGRVPTWYKWKTKINYISTTGIVVDSSEEYRLPGEIIYPKNIDGYKNITESITIEAPNTEYNFTIEPIVYSIDYDLQGGECGAKKTSYTVEDLSYYPPDPVKYGYQFDKWTPECINHGEYGNVLFVANYTEIEVDKYAGLQS